MKISHRLILLLAIGLSFVAYVHAHAEPIDILTEAELSLILDATEPKIELSLAGRSVTAASEWDLVRLGDERIQFKRHDWSNRYFELNLTEKTLYRVGQGVFGEEGGFKVPSMVRNIKQDIAGNFHLQLIPVVLSCKLESQQATLTYEMLNLAAKENFSLAKIDEHTVQVKHKDWGNQFWQADSKQQKVWATSGLFGVRGEELNLVKGAMPVQIIYNYPTATTTPAPAKKNLHHPEVVKTEPPQAIPTGWPIDLALTEATQKQRPLSSWLEKQKASYREVIAKNHYGTLLAPVQVNGYAIDRPGRSLLTRFIHQRLAESGFELPNPTLIARALGEQKRTYTSEEIISLGKELKVSQILIPAVGHDENMRLTFSIMRLSKEKNGQFEAAEPAAQVHSEGLAFSDRQLPFMVALPEIDNLLKEVGIALTERQADPLAKSTELPNLPTTPSELFAANKPSVLANAYYLQLFGLLHPKQTVAKENLFERSLVAAWSLSKDHPERSLLIARALFHLHRRPAAIKFLGQANSIAEKTFLALLNGNLAEVQQLRGNITTPLKKLLADIEYKDLLWSFTQRPLDDTAIAEIIGTNQEWGPLLKRRLLNNWIWQTQPNMVIKNMLDEAFPIAGFTAESLLTSQLVLGESPLQGATVELVAYEHYRRILTTEGSQLFAAGHDSALRKSDYLDLLYLTSEANLIDSVAKSVILQHLADRGLNKLRDYSASYEGHPYLTYLKSEALRIKAKNSRKAEKDQLNKEANRLRDLSGFWAQGQTIKRKLAVFQKDFPKRSYWAIGSERYVALENSLIYTHDNFKIARVLYDFYNNPGREEKRAALLDKLARRFVGHPQRQSLLAQISERQGDGEEAERYYRAAITLQPREWQSYLELAEMLIRQDRLDEAAELMSNFAPFAEPDPTASVGLSKDAYRAGKLFYQLGLVEPAAGFYQVAQGFQTGSSAEMYSSALLSLIEGDFQSAAEQLLLLIRRYQAGFAYSDYIRYLHLFGQHQQAWAVFDNLPPAKVSDDSWRAALFGLRIEGKTEQQIDDWFAQRSGQPDSAEFVLRRLVDRNGRFDQGYLTAAQDRYKKKFIDTYLSCKNKQYEENHHFSRVSSGEHYHRSFLPYLAIQYSHFGRQELFAKQIHEFITRFGLGYETFLAEGISAGLAGNSEAALGLIRKAWLHIPSLEKPFLPPLYQLAEICEWLYQQGGAPLYLQAGLRYADLLNQKDPLCAWPYAIQAKYAKAKPERMRLLGIALYLDKNSARVAGFSTTEREQAKKNFNLNEFLRGQEQSPTQTEI